MPFQPSSPARPGPDEYAPYYGRYINALPEGDLLELLPSQVAEIERTVGSLDDDAALHRYAPGKWSIKQVLGHLTDAERIFAYRALRISRGDTLPLAGFEQNAYVDAGHFDDLPLALLLDEVRTVRAATISLVRSTGEAAWTRRGTASDMPISARALVWLIASHTAHHLGILRSEYGLAR